MDTRLLSICDNSIEDAKIVSTVQSRLNYSSKNESTKTTQVDLNLPEQANSNKVPEKPLNCCINGSEKHAQLLQCLGHLVDSCAMLLSSSFSSFF